MNRPTPPLKGKAAKEFRKNTGLIEDKLKYEYMPDKFIDEFRKDKKKSKLLSSFSFFTF